MSSKGLLAVSPVNRSSSIVQAQIKKPLKRGAFCLKTFITIINTYLCYLLSLRCSLGLSSIPVQPVVFCCRVTAYGCLLALQHNRSGRME